LKDDVFVLETMYWPDEIRAPEFEELSKSTNVRDAELKMARQLIQQLSSEFKPGDFQDDYRQQLEKLVDQKVEGEEITVTEAPEEPPRVVDLMEALKASVAEAKQKKESATGLADEEEAASAEASAS